MALDSSSVEKARESRARARNRAARRVETRARGASKALEQWLLRFGRRAAKDAELSVLLVQKAEPPDYPELEAELSDIIGRFGMAHLQSTGEGYAGSDWVIPPSAAINYLAGKEMRIKAMMDETRRAINESVRQILIESEQEFPRPTRNELARRIRRQFHGPATGEGRAFEFSAERAQLIARTELAQAENTATFEAAKELGAEEIEWLAFSDGKSGDRQHNKMDGVRIKVGEKFRTPLGHTLRFPGDPSAPIKETANCRCSVRPVRYKKPKG